VFDADRAGSVSMGVIGMTLAIARSCIRDAVPIDALLVLVHADMAAIFN
jgi:hypothetical protein